MTYARSNRCPKCYGAIEAENIQHERDGSDLCWCPQDDDNEVKKMDQYKPNKYVKKPIPIVAQRMREAFTTQTMEGTLSGKAGDYLMTGVRGEQYPCDADVFHQTYEPIVEAPVQTTTEPLMQHFVVSPSRLTPREEPIAQWYFNLAQGLIERLPRNPERTVALRKLLESRDAALRTISAVYPP